jgi:glutamine synthetase
VAVMRAVAKYSEILRVSVAFAGNDHRLGANEAPPAIISIFLGDQLQEVIQELEKGSPKTSREGGHMEVGVSVLPKLPREAGDRNRTSPFAFTGNKFEFRAVGSSQNIAGPNTVLNTIVAESLDYVASQLESATKGGKDLYKAIQDLLPAIIKESKKVLFMGDNYSPDWHAEAERRGLPNIKNTVDCMPIILRKDTIDLFVKYGVYSERELQSRYTILCEQYCKTVNVEGRLTSMMGRTMILPAALRYQAEVAAAANATKSAGVDNSAQIELLKSLTSTIGEFQKSLSHLDHELGHHADGDVLSHAKHYRDKVYPAMNEARRLGDKLEGAVADDLWPLPTYREMLFIK